MGLVENGVRILWKYWHRRFPEIHYSWERWSYNDRKEYYEKRFPPEQKG
jgi:hypothetical protein